MSPDPLLCSKARDPFCWYQIWTIRNILDENLSSIQSLNFIFGLSQFCPFYGSFLIQFWLYFVNFKSVFASFNSKFLSHSLLERYRNITYIRALQQAVVKLSMILSESYTELFLFLVNFTMLNFQVHLLSILMISKANSCLAWVVSYVQNGVFPVRVAVRIWRTSRPHLLEKLHNGRK